MRWTRICVPLLAAAFLLAGTVQGAMAETTRVDRAFDRVIELDEQIAKYGVVGVGDFNGDGYDDVIFQGVLLPITFQSTRWLELVLGPFDNAREGAVTFPTATLSVARGNATLSVAVADVNGDGIDDITIAEATRRGIEAVERQNVSITFGREQWDPYYYIGEASRGDRKLQRLVELPEGMDRNLASVLTVEWSDLNQDGHLDLVLAADPPDLSLLGAGAPGGGTTGPRTTSGAIREGNSRIVVMYGDSDWLFWQDADEELGRGAGWVDRGAIEEDAVIGGLGQCERSLAGVGDVNGDGLRDLITRRCLSEGVPDQLGVVLGQDEGLRGFVQLRGAIPDRPPPDPGQPRRPPPVPGYYRPPDAMIGSTLFARIPTTLIEDFNDDGVDDVAFEFSDKTHVFLGGEGIADRILDGRSDRVMLRAGTAGMAISRTWRRFDVDGDGERDLMLTLIPDDRLADPFNERQGNAGSMIGTDFEPIHVFTSDELQQRPVLDLARTAADHVWDADATIQPWALGDFNGDGIEDVILGSLPGLVQESIFPVLFGPFVQ